MSRSIGIRDARPSDLPWLVGELRRFDHEAGLDRSLFPDMARAVTTLTTLMHSGPFYVADDQGTPVGFIAGVLSPHYFNPDLMTCCELLWWVVPERRGSTAGAKLLDAFLSFGRANADWVICTVRDTTQRSAMRKRGLVGYERSFIHEVVRAD